MAALGRAIDNGYSLDLARQEPELAGIVDAPEIAAARRPAAAAGHH